MLQPSLFDEPHVRLKPIRETKAVKIPPVVAELKRRESNCDRVLARLKQGPASTSDLIAVGGCRAGERVHELRKKGHAIAVEHISKGLWIYTLDNGA